MHKHCKQTKIQGTFTHRHICTTHQNTQEWVQSGAIASRCDSLSGCWMSVVNWADRNKHISYKKKKKTLAMTLSQFESGSMKKCTLLKAVHWVSYRYICHLNTLVCSSWHQNKVIVSIHKCLCFLTRSVILLSPECSRRLIIIWQSDRGFNDNLWLRTT